MFYILQSGKEDCSFACLEMLLANCHNDKNYLYLKHEDKPYNFRELIQIAKQYNTKLLGVKVPEKEELRNCKEFPFVALLKQGSKKLHGVLVTKIDKKNVYFFDPQLGKRSLKFEEFCDRWSEYALVIKSFEKTKCDCTCSSFIRRKDIFILSLLQIISSAFLLVGTLFIDKKETLFIPIIFLSVFIVFEILFRSYLIKSFKHIDDDIFSHEFKKTKSGYGDIFKTIQEYKSSSLVTIPSIICCLFIAIFVSVILILNKNINFIYVIICLSLSIIKEFVLLPKLNSDEAALLEKESNTVNAKTESNFVNLSKECSVFASQIAYKKVLFTYVEIAILTCLSIIIMYLTDVANITYVIFYLCICYFMETNFARLFEIANKMDHFDSIKAKLNNFIK